MGLRGLQQVQAVCLGLAQRLLVAKNDFAVVIFDAAQSDESAPLGFAARGSPGTLKVCE